MHLYHWPGFIYVLMHLYIMFSKLSKLFQEFWATVTLVAVWPKLTEVPLLAVNFSLLVDRKPLDVQKRSKRTLVTWALRPTSGDSARLPDSAHARLTRSEAIRDCCKRLIADLVQHRPPMDAVIPPGCSLKASQNRPRRPRKKRTEYKNATGMKDDALVVCQKRK
jgi:hypothetical protein